MTTIRELQARERAETAESTGLPLALIERAAAVGLRLHGDAERGFTTLNATGVANYRDHATAATLDAFIASKEQSMPTVRKTTPPAAAPALPELPAELAGWRWSTNAKTGHYFLMHPEHPATFTTRQYPDSDKAIAEAKRWMLSQPKETPVEPLVLRSDELLALAEIDAGAPGDPARQAAALLKQHGYGCEVVGRDTWHVWPPGVAASISASGAEVVALAEQIAASTQATQATPAPLDHVPILVDLAAIADNPFQPRLAYDAERIGAIAASIEAHGLLQVPLARRAGDRYQLAFGHSRLRAFRQLAAQDAARFGRMPLVVRELGDEQMALHAWAENRDRADLTAFEEAKAIERNIAAFGWTQQAAADKLRLDRSTIANKLRLLRLPAAALEQLRSGALSERQALALLPLAELPEALKAQRLWAGNGIGYVDTAGDLIAKAADVDSSTLRQAVSTYVNSATTPLQGKPWRDIDAAGARAPDCADCAVRIKSSDRCPDAACASLKERAWRGEQAQAAAASVGLPTTACDGYNDHDTLSGVNLAAIREKAAEKACGLLAVRYAENGYFHHAVAGFPKCGIVCGHGTNKRCACKAALARTADPTVSKEARERHDRAQIRAELVAPAEAAVAQALAAPTPATWRTLLGTIDRRAAGKLDKDADLATIQAAIAAKLVSLAAQYNLDFNPDYGRCRVQIVSLLDNLGVPAPWAAPPVADDPAAAARARIAEALEFAGHSMAPAYLQEARVLAQQIDDLAMRMAISAEIAAADDVCAQTSADESDGDDSPLPELSDRLARIEVWIDEHLDAAPDMAAITDQRDILEVLSEDLDQYADDPDIADEAYEDLAQRIGQATMALLNLAEAGAAPELAEVGA